MLILKVIFTYQKDNHRIQKFSSEGDFIAAFGSEGTGDGQFTHLHGIAVDPIRNFVYATDTENYDVQKFSTDGTFLKAWGSEGEADGQFASLESVDVDSQGNVYVADKRGWSVSKHD